MSSFLILFHFHPVKFTLGDVQFNGFWQIYVIVYPPLYARHREFHHLPKLPCSAPLRTTPLSHSKCLATISLKTYFCNLCLNFNKTIERENDHFHQSLRISQFGRALGQSPKYQRYAGFSTGLGFSSIPSNWSESSWLKSVHNNTSVLSRMFSV